MGSVSFTCESPDTGSATFSFEADDFPGTGGGGAFGPFPGTATETGSFTITDGALTTWSSSLEIVSGTTTITGTKTLAPTQPESHSATCGTFDAGLGPTPRS